MKKNLLFVINLFEQEKCGGCTHDNSLRRNKSTESGCRIGFAPRTVGHYQARDPKCMAAEKLAGEFKNA